MKYFLYKNEFIIYALCFHISLIVCILFFDKINFIKVANKNISFNVITYNELPFNLNTIQNDNYQNNETSEVISEIDNLIKKVSFSVESKLSEVFISQSDDNSLNNLVSIAEQSILDIDLMILEEQEYINKNTEMINKSSKIYSETKKNNKKYYLEASITKDKMKLLKSKSLLLSYEYYQKSIHEKILRIWNYPEKTKSGSSCSVLVEQTKSGIIKSATFLECDKGMRDHVKKAIFDSSPLPTPNNSDILNDKILLTFKV